MNHSGIDFIGDIHGYADELEHLLNKLGYSKRGRVWRHSDRIAFFVGDFIDRGPKIVETLNIVRNMVEGGSALAVMGNHEYNAICFNREKEGGGFLREHSEKNIKQHSETLRQFGGKEEDYKSYIHWFESLPLFYESEGFRVVHATWDQEKVEHLINGSGDGRLSDKHIYRSAIKGTVLYDCVDTLLKGKELNLPKDYMFYDKDGHERNAMRVKWWESPEGHTYESIAVGNIKDLPDLPIQNGQSLNDTVYGRDERPVFFGHYWLRGNPSLYRDNICCLDYSVAKGGKLVAYQFDGEAGLQDEKLVYV